MFGHILPAQFPHFDRAQPGEAGHGEGRHGVRARATRLAQLICDHLATSLSIEPGDFDYAPFSQRDGLGKAHQLFSGQLPKLLDKLNGILTA